MSPRIAFFSRLLWQRKQTRRRSRPLATERLESRQLMAADVSSALAVNRFAWNGETVTARADAWIVGTDAAAGAMGLRSGWQASSLGEGLFSLVAPGASATDILGWSQTTVGVRSVEPDRVVTATTIPNDPSFNQLWGLNNTGQTGGLANADIDAPAAWDVTTGSRSVVVAVIDSGIDYNHPDLAANVWHNPGETAGDGIDNDANGFVDDVYGWNFVTNTANVFDDHSHGTHVAGTIGAVGNNGSGITGVNWQVSIMGLKAFDASGSGTTSNAILALNYATMMRRTHGVNIVATNNSWGGSGGSTALRDAITAGGNAGILCIAAAGNNGSDNDSVGVFPANYVGTSGISVAATDSSNRLWSRSNYGATSVQVAAPGVEIYSTTPNNTYESYSGTSMATPHVAGLVALMAAANPQATAAQIRSTIISTVTAVPGLAGKCSTGGVINASAAVQAIRDTIPPAAPTLLNAVAGPGKATLSWQAPASNGSPILDYAIESSADGGATWIPFAHAASAATSATVGNLSNGGRYRFRVAAINSVGRGEFAYTSTDTIPFGVPAAPTLLSAVAGPGQVSLAWVAPEVDGGNQITDYVVQVRQAGWNWTTWNDGVSASTTSIIRPLQGNTAYSFRVAAVNAAGTGLFTDPSALQTVLPVVSVPTEPLSLVATPAGDAAILSWLTPASSGSSPISDYSIHYSSDHAATWRPFAHSSSTATAAWVTGLETGKGYLFRVAAVNSEGSSVFAVASVSLPAAPPPPPTLLVATAGAGSAVLSWQPPQFAGGSPLTGYSLQSSTDGGFSWSQREPLSPTATSAVVTGLVGGQSIIFRVAAANLIGTGAYSAATTPVVPTVPITVPAAPTNVVASAANPTQKWVSWNAPANGGSPIRDYTVQSSSNGGQTWTTVVHAPSAATAVLVTGLSTRFRYTFRVAAVNDIGTGAFAYPAPPSTQPAKPVTVAGVPTKLTAATTGTGEKTLSWQAPASNGGSAITTYVVQYAAVGGGWVTLAHAPSTATSLVVSGLNPRLRYSFRVAAVNSVGTGAFVRA